MLKNDKINYLFKVVMVVAFLIIISWSYLNYKYIFISGKSLLETTDVILDGDFKYENQPVVKIDSKKVLIPLFQSKEVTIESTENVVTVYNTVKIANLEAYQTYNYTLEFKVENLPSKTKIIVGSQAEEIKYSESETGKVLNNIDLENSMTFEKGVDNYFEVPITFTANESGNSTLYIGFASEDEKGIDYTLSQLRLKK